MEQDPGCPRDPGGWVLKSCSAKHQKTREMDAGGTKRDADIAGSHIATWAQTLELGVISSKTHTNLGKTG